MSGYRRRGSPKRPERVAVLRELYAFDFLIGLMRSWPALRIRHRLLG